MAAEASKTNNVEWPPLISNRKEGDANKGGQPRVPEIDYLTEKEKKQEATYLKQMAEDDSPWTARTRHFLKSKEKETGASDLSLAKISDISPDSEIIKIDKSDILPVLDGWGLCLAGIFVGRFPGKQAVLSLMKRWPSDAVVSYHSKGWMFFQFPSLQGLRATLEKGPFSIFGIPLHLEPVNDDFSFSKEIAAHLPVWIRIPDLPPILWTKKVIEKIASTVGSPIQVDEATIKKEFLDGPRAKVEINATVKPRDSIELMLENGKIHTQKIFYESHPKYCAKCRVFGHFGADCLGPEARGRYPAKQAGGYRSFHQRPTSRGPNSVAQHPGDRPPSRPSSRPPQRKLWQPRQQPSAQPVMRSVSPNRFVPLRDQVEDEDEEEMKETEQAHQPKAFASPAATHAAKIAAKAAAQPAAKAAARPAAKAAAQPAAKTAAQPATRSAAQNGVSPSTNTTTQATEKETQPILADHETESSSYHSSDTAVRFVGETPASPPSVQMVEVQQNSETEEDDWETHVIPSTPFAGKGNSDITSPSLSSNTNCYVAERVKETVEGEVEEGSESEDETQLSPPPSPKADGQNRKKKKEKAKEVAEQALQKIKHAMEERNQKHDQQPSNKKKIRKGASGSKKRR